MIFSRMLTEEYQAKADSFDEYYRERGCTCFQSAPCSYCTDPGNPENLENNEDAWR